MVFRGVGEEAFHDAAGVRACIALVPHEIIFRPAADSGEPLLEFPVPPRPRKALFDILIYEYVVRVDGEGRVPGLAFEVMGLVGGYEGLARKFVRCDAVFDGIEEFFDGFCCLDDVAGAFPP